MLTVALLGGGIFARDAHIPALNDLASKNRVRVHAVYSRTEQSALQAKERLKDNTHVKIYWGDSLSAILNDKEIQSVVVCLPIDIQPSVILSALKAGKHVFSEKPAAPSTKSGEELIKEYRSLVSPPIWSIAENYYYEPNFVEAKRLIQEGKIGSIRVILVTAINDFNKDNKYYHTAWRQQPNYFGGVVLDGGVHTIAGLRLIVGDIECLSGLTKSNKPDIPPADTLVASFKTKSGVLGTLTMTYGGNNITDINQYIFIGDKGTIYVSTDRLEVVFIEGEKTKTFKQSISPKDSLTAIHNEFEAFVNAIETKSHSGLYTPEQALKDVEFIETVFKNSKE